MLFSSWFARGERNSKARRNNRRTTKAPARRFRPNLEALENRLTPATHIWTGGATLNNNWMNDNNWNIGAPNSLDDNLVFPAGVEQNTDNNFPDGTTFNSITILGSGYSLRGNRLNLGPGGITANGTGATSNEIRFDMSFGATRTITVGSGDRLEISRVISGSGGVTKAGAGTLVFTDSNTYSGATVVQSGSLEVITTGISSGRLGSAASGTVVESFARLYVHGPSPLVGSVSPAEPLTLQDSSRFETDGVVNWDGSINLAGGMATIEGSTPLGTRLALRGPMFGPGGWTAIHKVRLEGSAANSYVGPTQAGSGGLGATLTLDKTSGVTAIPGDLTIGTDTAGADPVRVELDSHHQIANNATLTIKRNGVLALEGFLETVGSLVLNSGSVETDEGTNPGELTLTSHVTANSVAANQPATIEGNLLLGTALRTFDVTNGPALHDLIVSANVRGSGGIVKEGIGTLLLDANNDYTGLTIINAGVLQVDGNQPDSGVHVNGGTLAGRGTVGALTVAAGGTVSPGDPTDPTAILAVRGDALFEPGSIYRVDLNGTLAGTGHDQLDVRDTRAFQFASINVEGATLVPVVGPNSSPGANFRIIDTDALAFGEFAGLPDEAIFTTASGVRLSVDYRNSVLGDSVVVTHENTATKVENLAVNPEVIYAGNAVTVTGQLTDPDHRDKLTLRIEWGDGRKQTFHPGREPFAVSHRYRASGTYVVRVRWFDEHGEGNSQELAVTVRDQPRGDLVLGPGDTFEVALPRQHSGPHAVVQVDGAVRISGTALHVVSLDEHARPGHRFTLIDNDGRDPVEGTFAGLPEGAVITMLDGARLRISYRGGKGDNDVVLTVINAPHSSRRPGTHQVTMTVLDEDDGVGTDDTLVTVL